MEELLRFCLKLNKRRGNSSEAERSLFRLYFINPFSAGIFGFATFFFFEIFIESAARLCGLINQFHIGLSEIPIATLGFALQFIIQILSNYK